MERGCAFPLINSGRARSFELLWSKILNLGHSQEQPRCEREGAGPVNSPSPPFSVMIDDAVSDYEHRISTLGPEW